MADTIEIIQGTATTVEVAGPTGPQGPAGAAGATGAQGPQGVPGTGLEVLTTQGDLLYQGASTGQRLPIGATGQILKVAGGIPSWANESGAVSSVAGKTGVVTLDKNDVGLGNVSNTAQVTSVTGTAPIASSGGTTPAISISAATTSAAGSMSSADKTKLDGIASGAEVNVQSNWTEADSGSDAFILNKPSTFTPSSHTHGNLTNAGAIGTTANLPLKTGTNGVIEAGSFSNTAGSFCEGNDARLSDARTPSSTLAHAASHAAGAKAYFAGQVGGTTTNIIIRADNDGTAGNSISLSFDGVDDIDTVLSDWNTANSSNTASIETGDGSQVPDNGESITLSGGINQGGDPIANPVFDTVGVGITPTGSERKFHQHGGKFLVESTSGSWGQFQIINPEATEASFVFAAGATAGSDGTIESSDSNYIWAFGAATFGSSPDKFTIGNLGYGTAMFFATADGKIGIRQSDPTEALHVAGKVAIEDTDSNFKATFDAEAQLNDDVTLTIPDQSGTLAVVTDIPTTAGDIGAAASGSITTSGLTQATARILGRTTASTGAVEEIQIGSGLSLSAGELSSTVSAGIPATLLDAKGDLIVASAADTVARLPVGGTNGHALVVDSAETLGMKWSAVSGVTSGSVDNAILRADGTGGAASQSSDLVIDDATTSTANNVAITNQHSGQTNSSLVLSPKGTGAIIIGPKPDGTTTGGNARGTGSFDFVTNRSAATQVASGQNAFAFGGRCTASANHAVAFGFASTASGEGAFAAGESSASQIQSTAFGKSTAQGIYSCAVGSSTAQGRSSFSAGENNTATGDYSVAFGVRATAGRHYQFSQSSGRFAANGDVQNSRFHLFVKTTNATATEMTMDGTRLSIPSGRVMGMIVNIVGSKSDGSAVAHYVREVCCKNVAGTSSLVGTVSTIGTDQEDNASTDVAITISDANDAVTISVTGIASETWRWCATVDCSEFAYGT